MNFCKHIPNSITCLNLISGCISIVMALQNNLGWAMAWICFAAVFDFFDGFAARLLKAYSPMGKELDSLADVVSFGVAPGIMLFVFFKGIPFSFSFGEYIPYLAFVIPAASGLRLAKFNIDDRQTTSFIGLPVPANALFWSSLTYSFGSVLPNFTIYGTGIVLLLLALAFFTSWLLVSEIPMFSLKIKSLAWKGNELRYLLIIGAVLFVLCFQVLGIAGTIVLYVILSLIKKKG